MKYSWHIVTLLLAVALTLLTISSLFESKPIATTTPIDEQEVILHSIMTRTSVRKYSDREVSPQTVETILKAGMAAPTAGNRQPWEFYVVRDTTIIRQFDKVTKYANPMAQYADVAIVVCGVPSEAFPSEPNYWVQDVSAATENILLAAHGMGLGAVWCGVYPGEDRVASLRTLLDAPDRLIPFNIVILGYPDAEPIIKDKWKPEKIHYYSSFGNKNE